MRWQRGSRLRRNVWSAQTRRPPGVGMSLARMAPHSPRAVVAKRHHLSRAYGLFVAEPRRRRSTAGAGEKLAQAHQRHGGRRCRSSFGSLTPRSAAYSGRYVDLRGSDPVGSLCFLYARSLIPCATSVSGRPGHWLATPRGFLTLQALGTRPDRGRIVCACFLDVGQAPSSRRLRLRATP
jgi:hypothetical protein